MSFFYSRQVFHSSVFFDIDYLFFVVYNIRKRTVRKKRNFKILECMELSKRGPKGPRFTLSDDDFDKIVEMCKINCTRDEVCAVFGFSEETLNRRLAERGEVNFASLYKKYSGHGKVSLRRLQCKSAEQGSVPMQIWLGKQWLGQRDTPEQSTGDDKPIEINVNVRKPASEDIPDDFLKEEPDED